jgi:hypothetical protein
MLEDHLKNRVIRITSDYGYEGFGGGVGERAVKKM